MISEMENQGLDKNDIETEKQQQNTEVEVKTETSEEVSLELDNLSIEELFNLMNKIAKDKVSEKNIKKFNSIKEFLQNKLKSENNEENSKDAVYSIQIKLDDLSVIFKKKVEDFNKNLEDQYEKNYEDRVAIIERLKNLYTNTEPGTNLFKEIREIKEDWANAGQVAKSKFKNLNNDYFHHLNCFYQMLDLNKEYREQEYAHNLEKRNHIIDRAKELVDEPIVQKALNELQYLHKLWKEEAEPVAEEFRDKTWEAFKEISNKIHERKSELFAELEVKQEENLKKKEEIIAKIKSLTSVENPNHNYWQQSIDLVEDLRTQFLQIGNVPRKLSNQMWTSFKENLRAFNNAKNEFYKSLKNIQHENLEKKQKLIQTAKDNMNSEDWDTAVPLFKKLQEDWKNIGHVPKNHTNKVWSEFRDACNTFFDNFRKKNDALNDDWKKNYELKSALLEELKNIGDSEGSIEKIESIKNQWNSIGKVPREKISINSEFNKTLREKLKINKLNEFDLKEEGLTESQLTDKARKVKNQISDLEAEIVKLQNNLAFFHNPSRENPLLKDTFAKLDDKIVQLDSLKNTLHNIISESNSQSTNNQEGN